MTRRYRGRHRRRSLRSVVIVALALLALIGVTLPGAYGAYLARITNNSNTAATASYFTCTSAAQGSAAANSYFAYPFGEGTGSVTATDVSAGTPAQTSRNGAYSTLANLGITPTGVTFGQANGGVCPRDNKTVITLNGTSGYVSGPATAIQGPNTFSIEIWFKTTVKQGKLIGFGNARTGASGSFDRHLYINTAGNLVFGVYQTTPTPATVKTLATTTPVTDGNWHQAVGTLSSAGMSLYVDGAQVGNTDTSATTGESYSGYWRIGYDSLNTGWPNSGTNYYFSGQLAFASAYPIALTPALVLAHYRAGTA